MDYERIHKVQMGVLSPSKLRMKLLGVNSARRKEEGSNSSRTSPSKLEDSEYVKDHLLIDDSNKEGTSIGLKSISNLSISESDKTELVRSKSHNINKPISNQVQTNTHSSSVHPMRSLEEEGNGDDSGHENGSTSSFEFHKGERSSNPLYRNAPSKWNDAEKWIINKQAMHTNALKKNMTSRKSDSTNNVSLIKQASHNVVGKFSFVPQHIQSMLVLANEKKEDETRPPSVAADRHVESVSMRDVGTEMTPIPSQDPSTTATPLGSITPIRSPRSTSPKNNAKSHDKICPDKNDLSESELKLKTRREIAALGMKLGKKNIAMWASKESEFDTTLSAKDYDRQKSMKDEYEARALAWEQAEKAKHMARYKEEEVNIQVWESHQKAKVEAKMKKLEVEVEQMKKRRQEKIARKIEETRCQVEERRAYAEAKKNQMAVRTARKLDQIRQNGRLPYSHNRCCSWFI